MKILNFAIILISLFAGTAAFSQGYDIARLTTKTGKIYREVQIMTADRNGLLFRHSGGIAKESFTFLSDNIRDMFEPVSDVPEVTEINLDEIVVPVESAKALPAVENGYVPDLTLTLIIRRPVSPTMRAYCDMHPNPANWPSHWHRFHPAHYLTNPLCREVATRNLLQASGLLPQPCGRTFHYSAGLKPVRF